MGATARRRSVAWVHEKGLHFREARGKTVGGRVRQISSRTHSPGIEVRQTDARPLAPCPERQGTQSYTRGGEGSATGTTSQGMLASKPQSRTSWISTPLTQHARVHNA